VPLVAPPATFINWSQGVPAAALAGLLMAIPTAIPIVGAGCCLWVFGAGALSVLFYSRKHAAIFLTRGMGARLGVLSGFFGFFIYIVLESVKVALFHLGGTMREAMRQAMERSAAQNPDPHAQQVMQWFMSPAGQAFLITFLVALSFIAFLLLAAAGGAVGAAIWGRKSGAQA
jgi:hypothetical protein